MNSKLKSFRTQKKQHGAVLVVGLLLLVVITVLAVSGMNTATTELAMARNDQNYENAFQAAETGLEQALAQGNFVAFGQTDLGDFVVSPHDNVAATIDFEDTTLIPDRAFSLGVGSGVSAYHFVATASAESKRAGTAGDVTDRDSSAVHTQAFYIVGPEASAL